MDEILDESAQQALRQAHEEATKESHDILTTQVREQAILIGKLEKDINLKNRRIARRDSEISNRKRIHQRELDAKNRRISKFIARLGYDIDGVLEIESTWQEDLKTGDVEKAYKKACRVNNQSCHPLQHGLVYISKPVEYESDILEVDEFISLVKSEHTECAEPVLLDPQAAFRPDKSFNFSLLLKQAPLAIAEIANYVMMKETPIHVVIRLDVHGVYPPQEGGIDRKTGLPFRFHWGGRSCAINSAPLPKDVLAPLVVCRAWLEIFGTCFYAKNTFSFQSLGELGIFMDRIGVARRHRIQSMELWWIGSHMSKSDEYEHGKRYSLRTWALHLLTDLLRLRTLKLFVNESGHQRIRKMHEPDFVRGLMENATEDHENSRMRRDLRKALGTDWIYQLRGIKTFEVYDYNAAKPREPIRDKSFIDDIHSQVMQDKSPEKTRLAETENLKPLIGSQTQPSRQVRMLLRHFLDGHPLSDERKINNRSINTEPVAVRGVFRSRRSPQSINSVSVPRSNSSAPARGRVATNRCRNFIKINDDIDVIMIDAEEEPGFEKISGRAVNAQRRASNMRSNRNSSGMARQVNLARYAARTQESEVRKGSHTDWATTAARSNSSPPTTSSTQEQAVQYQMRLTRQARAQQQNPTLPQT